MSNLYSVPLNNAVQRSLGNTLNQGETATITFSTSVSGVLQASASMPGLLVIDRVDANGTPTPSLTEYISFTGVSGSTVTGLTRGLAGTSDIAHSVGSIVEFVPDVTWANAINDTFTEQHNADGTHKVTAFSGMNAPEGFLINGRINVTSGASLSLSLSLKTLNGSNPTTTNPIYARVGNDILTISSALTLNLPAGTNWFGSGSTSISTNEVDYFVYLGNASGTARLGLGRIPYAQTYNDFNTTNTNEKHISFNSLLTTNENCTVIGRLPATLSATPNFTWSLPTLTNTNLIQRPVYETRWLTRTGTTEIVWTGTAPTTPSTSIHRYRISGNKMELNSFLDYSVAGVSNTQARILMPMNNTVVYTTGYGYVRNSSGVNSMPNRVLIGGDQYFQLEFASQAVLQIAFGGTIII